MPKVLLVEDTKETKRLVEQSIGAFVELMWCENVASAWAAFAEESYDLVILDIELPDGDGVSLCNEFLASNPSQSIFFLTASGGLGDKVLGFSAGAEDYVTKPFEPLEFRARVEARLRKNAAKENETGFFKWDTIRIDTRRQTVEVFSDDWQKKDVTTLEFRILVLFAERPGEVLSRDFILDQIWGKEVHVYSRSVDTHVSKLRRKLDEKSDLIVSIHGSGYKFDPNLKTG